MIPLAVFIASTILSPPPPIVHSAPIQDSPVTLTIGARRGAGLRCAVDGGRPAACMNHPRFDVVPGVHTISVRAVEGRRVGAAKSVSIVVPAPAPPGVKIGADPVSIAADAGVVWTSNGSSGTVSAVDTDTRAIRATIHVGGQLGSIAATDDAIWLTDFGGGSLVRIDPSRDSIVDRISVGGRPTGIAVDSNGGIWVANLDGYVSHVDPSNDSIVARVKLPAGGSQPLAARGRIWVGLQSGVVVAIDPGANAITGTTKPIAPDVDSLVDTPKGIWVSTFSGSAALIDPGTLRISRRIALPGSGSGIAFAGASVWVSVYDTGLVLRLDPARGAIVGAVRIGGKPRESVEVGGALWVVDEAGGTVTPVSLP
jgi:DNA-binding beta-propeller fold protein YncE